MADNAARRYGFAGRVGHACEWLDEHLPHRFMWLPGRRLICSAADTSYGWNPEAIDWEEKATWLDRWIDRRCRPLNAATVEGLRGWWYTLPDGTSAGPFKRREIATRWRRYRIIRRTPPQGAYVPRLLAWQHAGIDPFVGGTR